MGTVHSSLCALAIGSSLSIAAAQPLSPTPYRVFRPGPVIPSGNDKFELTGIFTVAPDPVASSVQETSHGSGGACIVADLAKHGAPELSCTSSSQCHSAWASYHQANLSNANFDAAAFGAGANGACIANRCWYRPATQVAACVRRFPPNAWEIGHHKFGPISFRHVAQMYGNDAKIDWQVATCANRAQPNGTDATSCPQGAGIYNPGVEGLPHTQATDWESRVRQVPDR